MSSYLALARMWLRLESEVSRHRGSTSGRHAMRLYQWCKNQHADPLELVVMNTLDGYYGWMAHKSYALRTIRSNEQAFNRFRTFLTETPQESCA